MALYEVVISGLRYSQVWQNKLHFESVDGFAGNAQSIANTLNTEWVDVVRFLQTGDTQYFTIAVKSISGVGQEQFTLPLQKTGAQGPESQATSFIAGVVQKKTGLAGRANRGRIYIPGIRQGATQFGQFQQAELTLWSQQLNLLAGDFVTATPHGIRLVVKHPEGSTPVTSLVMRPVLGVMRTRNIGVGV